MLADGTTFEGEAVGWLPPEGVTSGEAVFNTVLSGYQEVITDPSYAGQIITFTYPHIGNYGVVSDDNESRRPFCRGIVVRDLARRPSSWRADGSLADFLVAHHVPAISGVDTRRLTRHLRTEGAMPAAFGHAGPEEVAAAAAAASGTDGVDHVSAVSTEVPYRVPAAAGRRPPAPHRGLRLRHQVLHPRPTRPLRRGRGGTGGHVGGRGAGPPPRRGLPVQRARRPAALRLGGRPRGRPGGPGAPVRHLPGPPAAGHRALGGRTFKLPFGHHGGNQPDPSGRDGAVEIASHNHNYALDPTSLGEGVEITHVNLNDDTVGGLEAADRWCFSVQYHPEAGPGPHDPRYLFGRFAELMDRWRAELRARPGERRGGG